MENNEPQGQWKCLNCKATKNVVNGHCQKCGPTQTVPLDDIAKKIGGFYEAQQVRNKAKKKEEQDKIPTATDGPK